jgi:hypothetical protein
VQHDGPLAVIERLSHGMGDHHGRQLTFVDQFLLQFKDESRGFWVKGGGMFIQQKDFHRV